MGSARRGRQQKNQIFKVTMLQQKYLNLTNRLLYCHSFAGSFLEPGITTSRGKMDLLRIGRCSSNLGVGSGWMCLGGRSEAETLEKKAHKKK